MSTPSSQAKTLVSALVNFRPTVLSIAATEASWQHKKGQISRASLDVVLHALKGLGWSGQAPPEQLAFPEKEYVIKYRCQECDERLHDVATYGTEAAIRIELERRARARLKLHSDLVTDGCMGILVPMGLSEK